MKLLTFIFSIFFINSLAYANDILAIEIDGQVSGLVEVELLSEVAPKHVERIKILAEIGAYDDVVFHRVIDGFMAQTGDVQFGNSKKYNKDRVGTGGSEKPDLKAEFNKRKHVRGTCSMARSRSPDSANSQFFICFDTADFLDGKYTVWGQVIKGMDHVDKIKRGAPGSGSVTAPDIMKKVTVAESKNKGNSK